MLDESTTTGGPAKGQGLASRLMGRKRRLTIGDLLVLVALLAVDLVGFRSRLLHSSLPLVSFVALFVILVVAVWLYVPKRHERAGFRAVLVVYVTLLIAILVRLATIA